MRTMLKLITLGVLCVGFGFCAPSLVLTTVAPDFPVVSEGSVEENTIVKESPTKPVTTPPIIYEFNIKSNISNRFATTLVTSKVKNPENVSKEATFTVVLPENAFISNFVMEIKGESYRAYVKEKEEAKSIYDKAVKQGQSAGHIAVSARDSNRFTVSVNVEPESKAVFLLTYEELLKRVNVQYELVLNIHPGQIVKELNVEVFINESRPLQFVRTPSLRSGNEISKNEDLLNPSSNINIINSTSAVIKFKPTIEEQKKFVKGLGGKENDGLSGQFVVQYDVERDPHGGEVLLHDGYFVHFFAPDDLKPLPKHVVYVLDTSGSMYGEKIAQLKQAMLKILDQLKENDIFHIIEFNTNVYVWDIENKNRSRVESLDDEKPYDGLKDNGIPFAVPATKEFIAKGKAVIEALQDEDMTNMMLSISTALHVVKENLNKNSNNEIKHQPLIIFLTDGEPTIGVSDPDEIVNITSTLNPEESQIPIFSLSFGDGADKNFLRKFSLKNLGFSRHIYEAADASLQLQDFFQQISSPLLTNVHFKYDSDVKQVTRVDFPIFFKGSELVVVGKYGGDESIDCYIDGYGYDGITQLNSTAEEPVSSIERLWAYLTVKQKLEDREMCENMTELTKEALDLALKYSFVTDVSSLVVVKPNETKAVDAVDASKVDSIYEDDQNTFISLKSGGFNSAVDIRFRDDYDFVEEMEVAEAEIIQLNTTKFFSVDDDDWKEQLPWLNETLSENNTLTIAGGVYDLEAVLDLQKSFDCPTTPLNGTEHGQCTPLKSCLPVFSELSTFKMYQKYFCVFDSKYAGVCCPKIYVPVP